MTYKTPASRLPAVDRILEALRNKETAVLTTHLNADGDGCGSQVAMAAWLRARGTEAFIVNPTPYPETLRFLVPDPSWVVNAASDDARGLCDGADVAVVLDTGEVSRIGRAKPLIHGLDTVVVDHHPSGDQPIAGVSLRDPSACATGELVYDIIARSGGSWSEAGDLGLYVAILTDTGSFRFSNSSAASHAIAAELIARGVNPEKTYRRVYGTAPLRRLKLLRVCLETLDTHENGRIAWMVVPSDTYDEMGAVPEDLEGLVDYPRSVEGVEVGLLFRKTSGGGIKISFRSNGAVDVNVLARRFGGGGHVRASGALVNAAMDRVRHDVIQATREAIEVLDALE